MGSSALVVDELAHAMQRADAEALYGLLSERAQRSISLEELRRIVDEQRSELADRGRALGAADRQIRTHSELRLADGSVVGLEHTDGGYRVGAANTLPAAARTPVQALAQLRRVLERRSYSGLLRLLSPWARSALEGDLRSLVEGLAAPEALTVDVLGDTATVFVPGGHEVRLKRLEGVWLVDDIE